MELDQQQSNEDTNWFPYGMSMLQAALSPAFQTHDLLCIWTCSLCYHHRDLVYTAFRTWVISLWLSSSRLPLFRIKWKPLTIPETCGMWGPRPFQFSLKNLYVPPLYVHYCIHRAYPHFCCVRLFPPQEPYASRFSLWIFKCLSLLLQQV